MAIRRIKSPALPSVQQLSQDKPTVAKNSHRSVSQPADEAPDRGTDANTATSSYEVGYCKPPRHTRFKPGISGNPRGRPKDAKGLKTIVRETLTAKVKVRTASGEKKMTRMEAVLQKTVELGMKGNPRALMQLITLYASAVPEAALPVAARQAEELSASDIAMLEEFKSALLAGDGEKL